jgi:hypothetical protein
MRGEREKERNEKKEIEEKGKKKQEICIYDKERKKE